MSVNIHPDSRRWFLTGGTVLFFLSLMLQPEKASAAVTDAMENFCLQLIPVLFPYMVLSHFFCTYGLLDPLSVIFPVNRLFHMGNHAFSVFLMGHLCGYPVGARMAADLVRQKKLTMRQGEILCAVSSGASPAFLIHAAGGAYWNDIRFGIFLLILQIAVGLLGGAVLGRRKETVLYEQDAANDAVPFFRCFCEAVGGSALQLVSIGGYIVFFSLLAQMLPGDTIFTTAAAAVLEFSSGIRTAAAAGGISGLFLTGFAAGFGGLSVLAQTAHMVSGSGIRLKIYAAYKLTAGFICGTGAMLYGILFPEIHLGRNVAAVLDIGGNGIFLALFFGILVMMWYSGYFPAERRQ